MPADAERPQESRRTSLVAPATDVADVGEAVVLSPLASLLAGNVIPQGELVQLVIKPSHWFILLHSVRFAATTALLLTALHVMGARPLLSRALSVQFGLFLISARVMWAVIVWMGRYYILTDLRVIHVSGVFAIDIQSCPLRRVSTVNFYSFVGERLLGKGCVEMNYTSGDTEQKMIWQTVSRPRRIHRTVAAAVARAKSNGCGSL